MYIYNYVFVCKNDVCGIEMMFLRKKDAISFVIGVVLKYGGNNDIFHHVNDMMLLPAFVHEFNDMKVLLLEKYHDNAIPLQSFLSRRIGPLFDTIDMYF